MLFVDKLDEIAVFTKSNTSLAAYTKTLNIEKSFTWITLYMKIITHAKKFRLTSVVSLFKGEKQHFVTKFCFIWGVVFTRDIICCGLFNH